MKSDGPRPHAYFRCSYLGWLVLDPFLRQGLFRAFLNSQGSIQSHLPEFLLTETKQGKKETVRTNVLFSFFSLFLFPLREKSPPVQKSVCLPHHYTKGIQFLCLYFPDPGWRTLLCVRTATGSGAFHTPEEIRESPFPTAHIDQENYAQCLGTLKNLYD